MPNRNALVEFVGLVLVMMALMRHSTEVSSRRLKGMKPSKKTMAWMGAIWLVIMGWLVSFGWRTFARHLSAKQLWVIGGLIAGVIVVGLVLWALEKGYQAFLTRVLKWPEPPKEPDEDQK